MYFNGCEVFFYGVDVTAVVTGQSHSLEFSLWFCQQSLVRKPEMEVEQSTFDLCESLGSKHISIRTRK